MTRRSALLLGAGTAVGSVLGASISGCASPFASARLRLGTGGSQGVYYAIGRALANAWQRSLRMSSPPTVRATAGSVENIQLLRREVVDVVFTAADVADHAQGQPGQRLMALARIYDDALQIIVPADSPIATVADLRGKRVSIGATDSGVTVIADRLLTVAGLDPRTDLSATTQGIDDSTAALRDGRIDAFFWSGGLPTGGVSNLAAAERIRLLDITPQMAALRKQYPVYDSGTVPAATYGIPSAATTLFVRNFLLVRSSMPDELAEALVSGMFAASAELVRTNPIWRAIDPRAAIGTEPVPLHPGAVRYYRSAKAYDL